MIRLTKIRTAISDSASPRLDRLLRPLSMAAVLAVIVVAVAACGSSGSSPSSSSKESGQGTVPKTILNTKHVALAIEQSIFAKRHVHAKVICPKVVPQQKGRNFDCIATIAKSTVPFVVVQQNDNGYVTYHSAE